MLGLYVTVPFACFRRGLAREYLETESIPPPSTCYGFLLSLVGEMDRCRHVGCRVTPSLIGKPELSVVLRTVWRVKKTPLGSPGNTRPDYQQLLSQVELCLWMDSSGETRGEMTLEDRIQEVMQSPEKISRFGGLCLGESTHMVNDVTLIEKSHRSQMESAAQTYLLSETGRLTLPVWVDHVGSAKTRYVTGDLVPGSIMPPNLSSMPEIVPLVSK